MAETGPPSRSELVRLLSRFPHVLSARPWVSLPAPSSCDTDDPCVLSSRARTFGPALKCCLTTLSSCEHEPAPSSPLEHPIRSRPPGQAWQRAKEETAVDSLSSAQLGYREYAVTLDWSGVGTADASKEAKPIWYRSRHAGVYLRHRPASGAVQTRGTNTPCHGRAPGWPGRRVMLV
jgi:hypothetical protein